MRKCCQTLHTANSVYTGGGIDLLPRWQTNHAAGVNSDKAARRELPTAKTLDLRFHDLRLSLVCSTMSGRAATRIPACQLLCTVLQGGDASTLSYRKQTRMHKLHWRSRYG